MNISNVGGTNGLELKLDRDSNTSLYIFPPSRPLLAPKVLPDRFSYLICGDRFSKDL